MQAVEPTPTTLSAKEVGALTETVVPNETPTNIPPTVTPTATPTPIGGSFPSLIYRDMQLFFDSGRTNIPLISEYLGETGQDSVLLLENLDAGSIFISPNGELLFYMTKEAAEEDWRMRGYVLSLETLNSVRVFDRPGYRQGSGWMNSFEWSKDSLKFYYKSQYDDTPYLVDIDLGLHLLLPTNLSIISWGLNPDELIVKDSGGVFHGWNIKTQTLVPTTFANPKTSSLFPSIRIGAFQYFPGAQAFIINKLNKDGDLLWIYKPIDPNGEEFLIAIIEKNYDYGFGRSNIIPSPDGQKFFITGMVSSSGEPANPSVPFYLIADINDQGKSAHEFNINAYPLAWSPDSDFVLDILLVEEGRGWEDDSNIRIIDYKTKSVVYSNLIRLYGGFSNPYMGGIVATWLP